MASPTAGQVAVTTAAQPNRKLAYGETLRSRTARLWHDLQKFLLDYSTRPLHFFGPIGLLSTGAGALIGFGLVLSKLSGQHAIILPGWPLLLAAAALVVGGVVILCLGLVAEILSRTYYESQGKPIYALRTTVDDEPQPQRTTRWIDEPVAVDKLANERVRAIR
jgi:hypothetical protein